MAKKELQPAYLASLYEDEIYKKWEKSGHFTPKVNPKKKPFTISMPPPNATGMLHLGHAVMLAIQDILIRYNRMKGKSALWLPGTDHASIATQNKVEQILAKEGISRHELGRAKFLKKVEEYIANSQDTIRNQVRKMGASCDWTRERYTLDKGLSSAVQEIFIRMYNDDLIYRGNRIVNWCPRCESTLANDEVEYKDVDEKLYWIKYGPFVLATTRPETKLGDTAVAVHPKDKRYKDMIGKKYMIPGVLGEFEIIVVGDEAVDPEFGSGAVKVTPAHSFADFEIAQRHNIPAKAVIDEKGCMMKNCGKYAGMTTAQCRREIVKDMEKMGLIEKIEDYKHNLSVCYRCGAPIEPLISRQWFISVDKAIIKEGNKKLTIKEKSLEVVNSGKIKIVPGRFKKTYTHWMENLHDWCISRQIWFGHRIPIWYCQGCDHLEAAKEKPEKKCSKCKGEKWKQDPDTLDTWFSSGLWTFSTLGWPEKTKDLEYFHPTSVMETGYDILFFWIARMIIMTSYALGEVPFETVYLHGLIRDKQGRKMSKSLGNGIDPLEMIKNYGTDAVRLALVIGSTPGNDMRMYEEKIAGYRNFVNKIWNSARFTLMNVSPETLKEDFSEKDLKTSADKWIVTKLQELIKETDDDIKKFQLSEAGIKIYDFIWRQYCDWYLECSKGESKNEKVLLYILKTFLKLLHPFTPFVTEKIWEFLEKKKMLIAEDWPKYNKNLVFKKEAESVELVHQVINKVRSIRAELKVESGKKINAIIYCGNKIAIFTESIEFIKRSARLENLEIKEKGPKIKDSKASFIKKIELYLPLKDMIDFKKEKERINKEIEKKTGLIKNFELKLKNKGYLEKAPQNLVDESKKLLEEEKSNLKKLEDQKKALK
jgi:valyl-tRNA synthetase